MEKNDNLIPEFDDFQIIVDMTDETEVNEKETEDVETTVETVEDASEIVVEESTDEVEETDETAKAVYTTLVAKGIVPENKDFKGSWEELEESLVSLPERVADDIIQSAPDITKKVLEFSFASGDNITKESLKHFINTYLDDIESSEKEVDVTTVEGARAFMKEQLLKTLKPVAVEAALDAMEDDDSLIDEAKNKLEAIKKINNHQKLIDDKIAENQNAAEQLKQKTLAIQKELVPDNYSKEAISVITDYLQNGKLNNVLKQAIDKPKALVQLTHFVSKFDKEKGEFNFDDFIKEAATPAVQKTKKNILKDSFSSLPKTTIKKDISQNRKYESVEPIIQY